VSLRKHNFGAESTKELLKPSKDSASLRVCNEKKIGGSWVFCEWHNK